jgi:tRNA(fMet)-specific endonuclease VapC
LTYIIDTDHVASWLNGRPEATALVMRLVPAGTAISIVTYEEIYDGIYFGRDPARMARGCREFLRDARVLPLTKAIMRRFARLRGGLRRGGQSLPDADLYIAATALHHRLTLVTRNQRHFTRVPELNLHA